MAAIQAREDAFKARGTEYQTNYVPKNAIKENPLAGLSEAGYTQDQIIQMVLIGPSKST